MGGYGRAVRGCGTPLKLAVVAVLAGPAMPTVGATDAVASPMVGCSEGGGSEPLPDDPVGTIAPGAELGSSSLTAWVSQLDAGSDEAASVPSTARSGGGATSPGGAMSTGDSDDASEGDPPRAARLGAGGAATSSTSPPIMILERDQTDLQAAHCSRLLEPRALMTRCLDREMTSSVCK